MRFLATGEEMQKIDQISIEQIGIPGLVLMERAAYRTDSIYQDPCCNRTRQ